jgi:hypothetical protein
MKNRASLKMPVFAAIAVLAVLLRAAAFLHNPAAYVIAVLLWVAGLIILIPHLRK